MKPVSYIQDVFFKKEGQLRERLGAGQSAPILIQIIIGVKNIEETRQKTVQIT